MMDIGKKIAWLREKKGWSQKKLAEFAGLNPSVMNRIEKDDRPLKADELKIIADLLEVESDYLLGKSQDPRLSAKLEKEVDKQLEELLMILKGMPEEKQIQMKNKIIAYAKGLADAGNDSSF
jgi:transcriptional regulator with XRE-family HTH domain